MKRFLHVAGQIFQNITTFSARMIRACPIVGGLPTIFSLWYLNQDHATLPAEHSRVNFTPVILYAFLQVQPAVAPDQNVQQEALRELSNSNP